MKSDAEYKIPEQQEKLPFRIRGLKTCAACLAEHSEYF